MWCGGGHLHRKCPENPNEVSTPACKLVDGEKHLPSNYRGCSQAKELKQRKAQKAPKNTTTPGLSFAAAQRNNNAEQQNQPQLHRVPATGRAAVERTSASLRVRQQNKGQSIQTPTVNSSPLDNMLRVVTVVQQIMTEVNCAVSEEQKIVAITKIVLNLMKQNGH
jgi:hypothetical protein